MSGQKSSCDSASLEFVALYGRYERNVYGYILSLIPNIAAADEISQETSLRLWEQFDQFDRSKDFGAWACTIAYYQVLKYRKKLGRERMQFDSRLLTVLADRASARYDDLSQRQSYLIECLSKLGDFKRQVVQLYYFLEMNTKKVAEKLGRNVAGVEKALSRARGDLHECIERSIRREGHS